MKYTICAALAIMAGLAVVPAYAQASLTYEQPNVGTLHAKEAVLDARLTNAYNAGLIDPFELANMRRDLDAIRVKEDAYRMSSSGLTSGGFARIAERLDEFQLNLDRHARKEDVIALPVIEIR